MLMMFTFVGSARIVSVLEDNGKQQWEGSGIYGLTDIRGEASIQVRNRGQASKPECVQNKLQEFDIFCYCHSSHKSFQHGCQFILVSDIGYILE